MTDTYYEAQMALAAHAEIEAALEKKRPSMLLRPRLFIDGDSWCALYGDNSQDGVAGFGKSPSEAYWDFDVNWHKKLSAEPHPAKEGK